MNEEVSDADTLIRSGWQGHWSSSSSAAASTSSASLTDFVMLCHVILDPQICAVNSDGRIELPNALVRDFIIHFATGSYNVIPSSTTWNKFKNALRGFRKSSMQLSSNSLLGKRVSSVASRSTTDDVTIFWV